MATSVARVLRDLLRNKGFVRTANWIRLTTLKGPKRNYSCAHNLAREAARQRVTGLSFGGIIANFDDWIRARAKWSSKELSRFCVSRKHFLNSTTRPSISGMNHVVNVVQLWDFTWHYLGLSVVTAGTKPTEAALKAEMNRTLDLIENRLALAQEISKRGLKISGRHGFFWLAPEGVDQVAMIGAGTTGAFLPAERVRTSLGLAHFGKSKGEVISLWINRNHLTAAHMPTVFDACGYPYFRVHCERTDGGKHSILRVVPQVSEKRFMTALASRQGWTRTFWGG